MSVWSHDITAAPRGKTVHSERKVGDRIHQISDFVPDHIWAASQCGKVIKSYWIPPVGKSAGRWSGFANGEQPIAWQHYVVPEHPFTTAPGDAAVTLGNVLRKPAAAEQGQNIREGDAPRETDRVSGDASRPDTDQPEKATKSGVGPLPGAAGADGTHKPAEDERSVEAAGGAALVLTNLILEDVGGGA